MRLQKQLSRRIGNTEYAKWVIVIPPKIVEEAQLKEGEEFDIRLDKSKNIILKKV